MVIQEHRDEETLEQIAEEDPVPRFEDRLTEAGIATDSELERMRGQILETIEQAAQYGIDAPKPDPAEVTEGMWA